jgi:hypothetical protein
MKKEKCKSWIVKCQCVVTKEFICDDCTEEQAKSDPLGFSVSEHELETSDWDVKSIKPNV